MVCRVRAGGRLMVSAATSSARRQWPCHVPSATHARIAPNHQAVGVVLRANGARCDLPRQGRGQVQTAKEARRGLLQPRGVRRGSLTACVVVADALRYGGFQFVAGCLRVGGPQNLEYISDAKSSLEAFGGAVGKCVGGHLTLPLAGLIALPTIGVCPNNRTDASCKEGNFIAISPRAA